MADTEQDQAPKRRVPLWVKLLLGASLALNLLIIGVVAGAVSRMDGPVRAAASYAMPYVVALERDQRREIFDEIREETRAGKLPGRKARRAFYQEMIAAIQADPFDRGAVEAVLARQRESVIGVQQVAQAAWLERIEALPLEARQAYAERLRNVLKRGGRPPHRK